MAGIVGMLGMLAHFVAGVVGLIISMQILSIELFNSHANVAAAKRLLDLLQDVFAELAERVAEDKAAIERITRGG